MIFGKPLSFVRIAFAAFVAFAVVLSWADGATNHR